MRAGGEGSKQLLGEVFLFFVFCHSLPPSPRGKRPGGCQASSIPLKNWEHFPGLSFNSFPKIKKIKEGMILLGCLGRLPQRMNEEDPVLLP